jgi:putative peptide zinc metalloprotease protein
MSDQNSLYSPSWYRMSALKPRMRSHARIHRQHFRGQLWFVLQDQASGRYHRLTPATNLVISLMDGKRSVQEIWDIACDRLDEDILTQDDMIRLLAQLHRAEVLHCDIPPDLAEMSERADKQRKRKLVMSLLNPLAVRMPLLDPDKFLNATFPLVRPLFSWFGALLFIGLVGSAAVLAAVHWGELTDNIAERILLAESLAMLAITYPFVKALHELGHGYAVKKWGGEVHELGVMFLVLLPVPYVDASASAAFRDKWRRAVVGSAGIAVELVLASIAMFVWLEVESGLVRAFAFNVMLIGGVSTLLFNGNPLLRFDGYYVLTDLIEIPNLGPRANRYITYLIQRYLFGATEAASPVTAAGERVWFVAYGLGAFVYRLFIAVAIILFVATKFFFIGVMLAIWSGLFMYGLPLAKALWVLFTSPSLRRCRGRAVGVTAGAVGVLAAVLLAMPVPYGSVTEGVVVAPGDAVINAGTQGLVTEILAKPNDSVARGTPLIRMDEPLLAAQVTVLEAEVRELELRYTAASVNDRVEAKIVQEQLKQARAKLELNQERFDHLLVRSPSDGTFILPRAADLPGRFVSKGETLAYVTDFSRPTVRVIVTQAVIDLVRQRTRAIDVRFADRIKDVFRAEIGLETPSATDQLPSAALSTMGGGLVSMDPGKSAKTLEKLFLLELHLDAAVQLATVGGRVYVRFDHGAEPLAWRFYRGVRQLFLRHFNV